MRLTYQGGKFELYAKPGVLHKELATIQDALEWVDDAYVDERAQAVFDRVIVKKYGTPFRLVLPESFTSRVILDPHQWTGVRWILSRSRSYLAHAPGAGKTLETIVAAFLAEDGGQALVIAPPSLTANWAREIERFQALLTPDVWTNVSVIPESRHAESAGFQADWVICPDSMLMKPWVLAQLVKMKKKLIAVDEASRFKESTSQRTIALFGGRLKDGTRSPGLIVGSRHAVLLDGSPMPNRPIELWAPTYAMAPQAIDFMPRQDFGFRYCGATLNDWGEWEFLHASNEQELNRKLTHSFMHVVGESELSHPERRRTMMVMSEDPRTKDYREWERRFIPTMGDASEDLSQGEVAKRRQELGESKVKWAARYVRERLSDKDESILVFAWHRSVCLALAKELKDCRPALIMGGVSMDDRETWFKSFQAGNTKLIIGNIAAMGRGINLQRADRVVFAEFSWTDELNKQCEKRASRRGNEKAFVRCDYVVCPNSVDEVVLQSLFSKARNVKRIIG